MKIVNRVNHLIKRQDIYYWRYRIPTDLIEVIGKREFVLSLRTSSQRRAYGLVVHLDEYVKSIIRKMKMSTANAEHIRMLSRTYFLEILESHQGKDLAENLWLDEQEQRHNHFDQLVSDAIWEERHGVYGHLEPKMSEVLQTLPEELQRADNESLERSLNRGYKQAYKLLSVRAEGDYSDKVEDAMFRDLPVTEILDSQVSRGIKLTELHELYEAERDVSKDTLTKHRSCLGLFIELFGDVDVSFITKAMAREFRSALMKLPKNRKNLHRGKSLNDLLSMEFSENQLLNNKTKNDYIGFMFSLIKWATQQGYCDVNVFDGMRFENRNKGKSAKEDTKPFNSDDLKQIFENSPLYTGRKSERYITLKGNSIVRDTIFWCPLISLYSGMRLGEITQLRRSSIRKIGGVWCFELNTKYGQSLKNSNAIRTIPIHSKLIELGLLEHIKTLSSSDSKPMWPDVKMSESGRYEKQMSRKFTTIKQKLGFSGDYCFHSFRHTFIDALKVGRPSSEEIAVLVGHESGRLSHDRYGSGLPVSVLHEMVESVSYDLNWSKLCQLN